MFLSAVLHGASEVHNVIHLEEEELKGMWFNKQGREWGAGKICLALSQKCHNQFSWKHQRSWNRSMYFGCIAQIRRINVGIWNWKIWSALQLSEWEKNRLLCRDTQLWEIQMHYSKERLLGVGIPCRRLWAVTSCAPKRAAIGAAWRGWAWESFHWPEVTFTAVHGTELAGNHFGDLPWF